MSNYKGSVPNIQDNTPYATRFCKFVCISDSVLQSTYGQISVHDIVDHQCERYQPQEGFFPFPEDQDYNKHIQCYESSDDALNNYLPGIDKHQLSGGVIETSHFTHLKL